MEKTEKFQEIGREDKALKYALLFSCMIHIGIIIPLSYANARAIHKTLKKFEVTYHQFKIQPKGDPDKVQKNKNPKENGSKEKGAEVLLGKGMSSTPFVKDVSKLSESFELPKKQPAEVVKLEVKRKVSVPPLKSEKINSPGYQDYYQVVRGRIKERAYANYSKLDTGEVYLTFVVTSDGTVKQSKLIDERTKANEYLKGISLKSIQEAGPFPAFPSNLKYPELSFNVVISFEMEE